MPNKKTYFVSVEKQKITDVSIADKDEYEIKAEYEELKELERLFNEKDDHEKNAAKVLAKPFNEKEADNERDEYASKLMQVYKKLYELGTNETKERIKTMGIND